MSSDNEKNKLQIHIFIYFRKVFSYYILKCFQYFIFMLLKKSTQYLHNIYLISLFSESVYFMHLFPFAFCNFLQPNLYDTKFWSSGFLVLHCFCFCFVLYCRQFTFHPIALSFLLNNSYFFFGFSFIMYYISFPEEQSVILA